MTGHSTARTSATRRSYLLSEEERQAIIYALTFVCDDERNTEAVRQAAFNARARLLP